MGILCCCNRREDESAPEGPDNFEWTDQILRQYSYGSKDAIANYETLRLQLQDVRKAGHDKEQALWDEIKRLYNEANERHAAKDYQTRDALRRKADELKTRVAALAIENEDKVFAVFNDPKNKHLWIDLIGLN